VSDISHRLVSYSILLVIEKCSPACRTCDIFEREFYKDDKGEDEDDDDDEEEEDDEEDDDDDDDDDDEDGGEDEDNEEDDDEPAEKEIGEIVPRPFGIPQNIGKLFPNQVRSLMDETYKYMTTKVYQNPEYENVLEECENRHPNCSYWAAFGECEKNKPYMILHCAPACHTCHVLDSDQRCRLDENAHEAFAKPGDLNALFERITTDSFWESSVISSPATDGPWVITVDNFVTDAECDRFQEIGYEEGYDLSKDVGEELEFDGSFESVASEGRTSTNAWCPDECREDPVVGPVHDRITKLTGIHYNHSEWLQLLKYDPGQFYNDQ
jgi:prolyl 4-hydroxylase